MQSNVTFRFSTPHHALHPLTRCEAKQNIIAAPVQVVCVSFCCPYKNSQPLPNNLLILIPSMVKRSSTIDTIWFNERNMPHSFFEVEHSTDIQNSLLKFNDLQDFYVRMAIVADIKRKPEFDAKMRFHAFDDLRVYKRVSFLSYDALIKQYEMELEKQSFDFIL